MKITPRYHGDPLVGIDPMVDDLASIVTGQRARLAATLAALDDEQWATPSRCEGWSVQDVIIHLSSTNRFWAYSIEQGRAGMPTRFLLGFDPVESPAQMVAAARGTPPADTLAEFVEGNRAFADALSAVDDWHVVAEAPPGHIAIGLVAIHALWDSWVHERDVVIPLGMEPVVDDSEIEACLLYASALGPAFQASVGNTRRGVLEVETRDPHVHVVVEAGPVVTIHRGEAPADAVRLEGDAVEVLECLSMRAPFTPPGTADDRWLFQGLAEVFDTQV
ncbi:MAG TPA: maleylpyruvate isomerase family mycothiol-dependent enzyme [Acidimicrobiales bacterium]|nr:maleylpyruvate isomerase family mycothiol-dependent enzyme [Acidimicrobiales bacterium]